MGVGWGAEVATMWVGDDETLWLHSLDGSQGGVVGCTALEFRAEVWLGDTNLRFYKCLDGFPRWH